MTVTIEHDQDLTDANEALTTAQARLSELPGVREQRMAELGAAVNDKSAASLQRIIATLDAEEQRLRAQSAHLLKKIPRLEIPVFKAQIESELSEQSVDEMCLEATAREIQRTQETLETLYQRHANLKQQIDRRRSRIGRLRGEIDRRTTTLEANT